MECSTATDHGLMYQFFTMKGEPITEAKHFDNENDAWGWLGETHPETWHSGVEMRYWVAQKGDADGR